MFEVDDAETMTIPQPVAWLIIVVARHAAVVSEEAPIADTLCRLNDLVILEDTVCFVDPPLESFGQGRR